MNKKQVIRINESHIKQIVMESVKRVLKEEFDKKEGINILKQASDIYMQLKAIEEDMSNYYKKTGYKPDGSSWYRCRDKFFEVMGMNRGNSLYPYTHPFIDSLAEIIYNYGLTVDDVVSLNIPPFNEISVEKIENAFNKYKDEMGHAERIQNYYDMQNAQQAVWDDSSDYISKTTGIPDEEL